MRDRRVKPLRVFRLARDARAHATSLSTLLAGANIDHAVTGPAGAARLAPFITSIPVVDIWITQAVDLSAASNAIGAEVVQEGHNILLRQEADDYPPLVFRTLIDDVWTVNKFRLYLDLRKKDPRRGREQADRLREEVIGFLSRQHQSDYDQETTTRCERALVTLLGDIGPWSKRVYLAGGLAPRYIVGSLPEGARPHVGTTDVDLVIGLAVDDESDEAYRTLEKNNLKKADFEPQHSFRWSKEVQGVTVIVEFLCETDQVEAGKIFKPKQGTGSGLGGAFNVRGGAQLVTRDYFETQIERIGSMTEATHK